MAARKGKDSYKIPKLEFEGEENEMTARARQMLGKELKDYIIGLNNNLYKQAPNKNESELIHNLFKRLKFEKDSDITTVSETVIAHNSLTKIQEKNSYGKVFGGYLMHRACEAALLNVRRFSGEFNVKIINIDTIKFIKPVEIGHIVQFRSRVTYTTNDLIRVAVSTLDITESNKEGDLTNEFHFVFKVKNKFREVIPESYFDALLYLEGKRRTEHLLTY